MRNAKAVFLSIIEQTKISAGLYDYLDSNRIPIDASDLLRWQWVLAVSALDRYIHDIVRIGMIQEFMGKRSQTDRYQRFQIDLKRLEQIRQSATPEIEFEKAVIQQNSFRAFQHPDKIAEALSFIWPENHKWDVISQNMRLAITPKDLTTKLNNIVVRRDQIVHEGDCFASVLPFQQQAISQSDVQDVISFITDLVNAIELSI